MRYDKKIVAALSALAVLLFAAVLVAEPQQTGQTTAGQTQPQMPPPVDGTTAQGVDGGAANPASASPAGEELVYLNVQDADIKDVIKQISKATQRNFIIDDKVRGKVTIISERPMTREEAYQTFLSALEVAGYTIVKGPAGVIKIVPLKEALQQPIPTHVDTTPVTDMFITRLIPLQSISAVEMSNAIKGLVSREGNLFAYPATNTLIITDSGTNIDRLMKIIKELDQEGPQQVLEIIPVINTSSRDVAQMVNQLFEQEKSSSKSKISSKKGGELEEIAEVSKIIPDERTNAIIVLASKRAIEKVRNIISRLDRKLDEASEGKIHVYYLKHAKAKTMAEMLSALTAGASSSKKDTKATSAGGPIMAEFEGGIKITSDDSTNALVITASAKDFQTLVEKVISKLDVARRQVYLEAIIMELSVQKGSDYGVKGFGGGNLGRFSLFGTDPSDSVLSGFLTGGTGALPTGLLGGLLGQDTIPINIDGTTMSIPSAGIFFSALASYNDANVISTPSILTLDNEEAKIEIKGKQYYQGNALVSATGTQFNTASSETGLSLKITPQIGEKENVTLKIEQSLSDVSGKSLKPGELPDPTKERSIKTSVVTMNGQTVVLGGLMEDKALSSKTKIPLLGDIPILGNLFKSTSLQKTKVNLLIFITPTIVKDATDFSGILKRKIEERNKFVEQNYGKRQREQIRQSIKNHREDLLDFKVGETGTLPPWMKVGSVPVMTQPAQAAPLPPATRAPVITAPQQPQTELGETRKTMTSPAAVGGTSYTTPPVQQQPYSPPVTQPQLAPSVKQAPVVSVPKPQQKPLATVTETPKSATPVVRPEISASPQQTAPAERVQPPVINVKPPAPGAREKELDLAY